MDYLDVDTKAAQRKLANDEDKDTFVYMHSTKWFNLESPEGRETVLCHILALLRWHEGSRAEGGARNQDDESPDEPEDDDDPAYVDSMDTE